jgi:hypothetical protein
VKPRYAKGLLAAAVLLAVAGCTSSGSGPSAAPSPTATRTVTETRSSVAASTYVPPPAATVKPLPPGRAARAGEKDGKCPYIRSGLNEDSGGGTNVADLEGDRVYRTTVLTAFKPAGCRFYFYAPPYEAVADIRPVTFATATQAYNAMVRTAEAGTDPIPERNFVKGVTGICFKTKFFGPDGAKDWAFAFAKGKVLVVIHTQRADTSRNALYLGRAVAAKF